MNKKIETIIQSYINYYTPHGHPPIGEDEIKIKTAYEILERIQKSKDIIKEGPVLKHLKHGSAGDIVDKDGRVICTMNLHGTLTVAEAFAYAEKFIGVINDE